MALTLGLFLLAASAALAFWHGKRRFDRRNALGIEQFTGYVRKLGSKSIDVAIRAGAICFGVIASLILARHFEAEGGWIVLLAAYCFMLFLLVGT